MGWGPTLSGTHSNHQNSFYLVCLLNIMNLPTNHQRKPKSSRNKLVGDVTAHQNFLKLDPQNSYSYGNIKCTSSLLYSNKPQSLSLVSTLRLKEVQAVKL